MDSVGDFRIDAFRWLIRFRSMNMSGSPAPLAATHSKVSILARFGKFFPLLILLLFAVSAAFAAESPDDQYFRIYSLVMDADALGASGKTDSALAKYQQAQTELLNFKKANPNWNANVVTFRLNYLNEKITGITQPAMAVTAPSVVTKPAAKTSPKFSADRVKLIDPGAEPRQVLRFHVAPDVTQTVGMTITMTMNMQVGEVPGQEVKMPAMLMTMEAVVKSVSPEGDISYESTIKEANLADEPGAAPQVAEAMKTSLAGINGLVSRGVISSRGISKSSELTIPPGANPQVRQSIEQMKEMMANITTPFPEEAVGPGAKWEVKMPVKTQGMTINQTATYQLVSIEGDRLMATTVISQSAANQKIQNPSMPGLKVDLTKMTGNGTGSVTFNLTQLMPVKANVLSHTDMAMGMNMGAQKQSMTMKMDMDIKMEAK